MLIDILNTIQNSIVEYIGEFKNTFKKSENESGDLYYVYAFSYEDVYITKQGSSELELLTNVSDEFKKQLAEGYILRYKDGKFEIDEELTEKSMNFELDFDNYIE